MSRQMFKLVKSPSNEITLSNTVAINSSECEARLNDSKYVKLNGHYDFKVTKTNDISPGSIGLGGPQRDWIKSEASDSVSVSPVSYENDVSSYLYQISVELAFYPRDPRKPPPPYDSDRLASMFIDTYNGVPFTRTQTLIIQPEKSKSQLLQARVLDLTGTDPDLLHKGTGGKGKKRDTGVVTHQTLLKFGKPENTSQHLTGSGRGSSTQASIISQTGILLK